jgi:hypothetical protein
MRFGVEDQHTYCSVIQKWSFGLRQLVVQFAVMMMMQQQSQVQMQEKMQQLSRSSQQSN